MVLVDFTLAERWRIFGELSFAPVARDSKRARGVTAVPAVVAHGAHTLQRPVKWISERSEEFLASSHGRDIRSHVEMALDATLRSSCSTCTRPSSRVTRIRLWRVL